jgi:hypothetical protein
MLRRCACTLVLAVMLVGLPRAQAADTTLTLACQGTTISDLENAKPKPISMGLILNFTARTVQGFFDPADLAKFPVKITGLDEVTVAFFGSDQDLSTDWATIKGTLNRVTGALDATSAVTNTQTYKTVTSTSYALKCRPTQRMF